MIVLRYAQNMVAGEGFVYNPGERVFGVTTPLYTLLSVGFVWVGADHAPVVQNIAGVVALSMQAFMVLLLLNKWGYPWAALAAALLTLGNYNLNYLYFGMEVHLFMALVLLAVYLYTVRSHGIRLGLVLGATFLLRYDAALLAGLLGLSIWIEHGTFPRRLVVGFFLPVLPWLIFAAFYFGTIVPEPFNAKRGQTMAVDYLRHVVDYYQETYRRILASVFPPTGADSLARLFLVPMGIGIAFAAARRNTPFLLLCSYAVLHVLVYAAIGADPNFTWHHYMLNPVGFMAACVGISELCEYAARKLPQHRPFPAIAGAAMLGLTVAISVPPLVNAYAHSDHRYRMAPHTRQLFEMAEWMRTRYPTRTSLLQPSIGILGYVTGFRMVDHAGLVTPGLYFANDLDSTPLDEVVARYAPDLVLLSQWSPADPIPLGYRRVKVFDSHVEYTLYERTGQ